MTKFLETVARTYNISRARTFSGDYEGVTHAGLAIVALDTGNVLLAQRAMDDTDDPDVQETWEFPGGSLDGDEEPLAAAIREYGEEVALPLPVGMVVNGWRAGPEENYQGFVYTIEAEDSIDIEAFVPNEEVQALLWVGVEDVEQMATGTPWGSLRPEMKTAPWETIWSVSRNKESAMTASADIETEEPTLTLADIAVHAIPIHGVIAPEEAESGDGRGFAAGAMTSRPNRLPFMWQERQTSGHDSASVVGSVDRMMRKDGLIHWEGSLMGGGPAAGDFAELLAFFGRFGVSVDGDKGSIDTSRSESEGMLWFDAVRAAGLTAVSIPAFHEAYVAFGPHPEMPHAEDGSLGEEAALTASLTAAGDLVVFDRGPGWVTNPKETKRIHDYWTKKGEPGYAKIRWGTPGDFTRAKKLIGEKIAANSPEDMRYLNQIIAQWHYDALGYWPGELGKPGNAPDTPENRRRAATHAGLEEALARVDRESIETSEDGWEAVLVSSATSVRPPLDYFHYPEITTALTIEEPDENGFRRTYGYAAKWGVCHIGFDGRCVEPPRSFSDDYPAFHLGTTRTAAGKIHTGVLTYGVDHRDAETILRETPEQSYFDNINNAWAAVRVGEDETGIWFSGVVLPDVPEEHLVKIEASGQVSGEWKHGAMRACLTVNVPGYPIARPSASYDENGNVLALAASAFGGFDDAPCNPTPAERIAALAAIEAEARMDSARAKWATMNGEVV
jgi:8-oxo-dGTP pyrophosphatase MutT (NUDIX family)